MPSTRIETRAGWLGARRRPLIDAVQRALVTGFLLPETDRDVRLLEYEDACFLVPPGRGPHYLVVEVTLFRGRSLDAKRRFYAALVDELAGFDVPAADIKTILVEVDPVNWGLKGVPASELDFGFRVDV